MTIRRKNTDKVQELQRRNEELERWFSNQDRQIRFLERERQKLAALVSHTDAAIVVMNAAREVEWVNQVARNWFGGESTKSPPATCNQLLCGQESKCDDCPAERAFKASSVAHNEIAVDVDEKQRHIYATAIPINSIEGETDEIILMLQDITDLEVLRRSQAALRSAKEEAEAANVAKSEFLANMSHEVRTPMTGVVGMTGLLMDSELTGEQQQFVRIIQSSADALLTILNDILDFSRIEAGKLVIESIAFDLRTAIDEVVDLLLEKASEKGIELVVRVASNAPRRLIGDPGRIRQVLINLASNAIKFTSEGHVFINVDSKPIREGVQNVRIFVEDTGIGVASDKREEIFGKFTQADTSITRRYGGAGLGLAISKQLVEMMGGTIELSARPGGGSRFAFQLELAEDLESEVEPMPTASLDGVRIAIVDNNELVRDVLAEQISGWGARAVPFATGRDGLAALRAAHTENDPYAMAIVSFDVSDMKIEDFSSCIKTDPDIKDLSLVMLTSVGQQGDVERLQAAGFDAYLTRPTRPSLLMNTLATVLGVKQRGVRSVIITRHTLSESNKIASSNADDINSGSRGHILLAEDNIACQRVTVKVLESLGYTVDVANNGLEAVTRVQYTDYDAVIMDCHMPEMDGFDATRRIRLQQAGVKRVPIIAMTANAMAGQMEKCVESGMDEFLSKPVKKEILEDVLGKFTCGPKAHLV